MGSGINSVTFGLNHVNISFIDSSDPSALVWETPIPLPGSIRLTPVPEGQTSTTYADNKLYHTRTTNHGYTAELEIATVEVQVIAEMLGWLVDDRGMLVEVTGGTPREFALLGQVDGDSKNRRFVYYRCQASRTTDDAETRGESIDPKAKLLTLTIYPVEIAGRNTVKGVLEMSDANANVYEALLGQLSCDLVGYEPYLVNNL